MGCDIETSMMKCAQDEKQGALSSRMSRASFHVAGACGGGGVIVERKWCRSGWACTLSSVESTTRHHCPGADSKARRYEPVQHVVR